MSGTLSSTGTNDLAGISIAGRRLSRPLVLGIFAGILVGAAGVAGLALVIGGPLALAHRQSLPLELQYGHYAIAVDARLGAGSAANPVAQDPRALIAGRAAYTGSCAECHGATGKGNGIFGQATYPPATDLTSHDAVEKSDAQLFWIVKNGLSFTGMPSFGKQYSDQQIWSIVSYLRELQSGKATPIAVPTPSTQQRAQADPSGSAVQQGAAVYLAEGCASCHGATGNAPARMALRGGGREAARAVRNGREGMPAYATTQISDAQMTDLEAYLNTFNNRRGGFREFGRDAGRSRD